MSETTSQKYATLSDSFDKLMRRGARPHAARLLLRAHAADVARLVAERDGEERMATFHVLEEANPARAALVLGHLDTPVALGLLEELPDERAAKLLQALDGSVAAVLLGRLEEERRERLLGTMQRDASEQVEERLSYPRNSAGRLMSVQYLAFAEETSVMDAIAELHQKPEIASAFYVYVLDERRHLVGVVSLRQLLMAKPVARLGDIMSSEVVSVRVDTDQEQVADLVSRYDFVAIPVLDAEARLEGIITVDQVIDVIEEEATEDILKMAGTSEAELFAVGSPLRIAAVRLPWLAPTFIGQLGTGFLLYRLNVELAAVMVLISFVPIVMAMGGNVGTQSATIMVRGISLGSIDVTAIGRILLRELRVGAVMASACAVVAGLLGSLLMGRLALGLIVGAAMFLAIFSAAVVGSIVPILLHRLRIDPAIASGPFVTTATDITGLGIYFLLASRFARVLT